jgi:hypothetical protein
MPPEKRRKKRKQSAWVVPVALGGGLLLVGIVVTVVILALPGDDNPSSTKDGVKGRPGGDVGKLLAPADDLRAIIAELDKKDPNWKLEQWLKQPLPEKNGAAQAMAAGRHLPQKWPPEPVRDIKIDPAIPLNPAQVQALRGELGGRAAALAEARKLSQFPNGRYHLIMARNPYETSLAHLQELRKLGQLLAYDVLLKLEDQDVEGALVSCQALFNASRCMGDEPTAISQLVRLALRKEAVHALARVLRHPRPVAEAGLAQFQALLEDEFAYPLMKNVYRGERAILHDVHTKLANGTLTFGELREKLKTRDDQYLRSIVTKSHASYLHTYTILAESADAPPDQWEQGHARARFARPTPYYDGLDPDWSGLTRAARRGQAWLACAIAAVACERYRLGEGKLPQMLKDLAPKYVKTVPPNPYTAGSLNWRLNEATVAADGSLRPEDNFQITLAPRRK